ncbi:MAG TPA: MBL fold metallo-hydrolase [Acidimicrobiales bacterium]|nr:MBL fold metallo-hydrolase [Acidimicrobiales bacterium]
MKVTYFGTRGSCPCSSDQHRRYGGNTSCVLVEVEDEPPLILDLGTGLRALGETLERPLHLSGLPLEATALLTHLHYDHILGLPFFTPLRVPGAVLDVYGPAQEGGTLKEVLSRAVQPPFFPIHMGEFRGELRFHDVDGSDDMTFGAIKVKARPVPHRGRTLGYRIEADGKSLAYLPDHQAPLDRRSVPDEVLELCEGADLVIHDAQYTDDEFMLMSDWGHSTVAYAVQVAAEAGAQRLSLFHHDPSHHDRDIDRMLSRARKLGAPRHLGDISAASERTPIDLGKA